MILFLYSFVNNPWNNAAPYKAIDGIYDSLNGIAHVSWITHNAIGKEFHINLSNPCPISKIILYSRKDCCPDQVRDAEVLLYSNSKLSENQDDNLLINHVSSCHSYDRLSDKYVKNHYGKGVVFNCWVDGFDVNEIEVKNIISLAEIEVFCLKGN